MICYVLIGLFFFGVDAGSRKELESMDKWDVTLWVLIWPAIIMIWLGGCVGRFIK